MKRIFTYNKNMKMAKKCTLFSFLVVNFALSPVTAQASKRDTWYLKPWQISLAGPLSVEIHKEEFRYYRPQPAIYGLKGDLTILNRKKSRKLPVQILSEDSDQLRSLADSLCILLDEFQSGAIRKSWDRYYEDEEWRVEVRCFLPTTLKLVVEDRLVKTLPKLIYTEVPCPY